MLGLAVTSGLTGEVSTGEARLDGKDSVCTGEVVAATASVDGCCEGGEQALTMTTAAAISAIALRTFSSSKPFNYVAVKCGVRVDASQVAKPHCPGHI